MGEWRMEDGEWRKQEEGKHKMHKMHKKHQNESLLPSLAHAVVGGRCGSCARCYDR
jgi:hypothetical protein